MSDEYFWTRQDWLAYLAQVKQQAELPDAELTPAEWRDVYLIQMLDRLARFERGTVSTYREVSTPAHP